MISESETPRPARQNSPWPFLVKAVFVIVLAVLIFILGLRMVHHRFFRGGWVNQHGRLMP